MITTPRYSPVGERYVDQNIPKLDIKIPRTHHEIRDLMGSLTYLLSYQMIK